MRLFLLLSKENLEISKFEAKQVLDTKLIVKENIIVAETSSKSYERLAYTKKVLKCLFICDEKDAEKWVKKTNFNIYNNYSVKSYKKGTTKLYARLVHDSTKAKVKLTNPENRIEFHFVDGKIFCGIVIWENEENFNSRKAHNRPELHPSSLNPKLARACINMTGIKKGTIVDPFCGSGGILIEAGLLKLKAVGYDIDRIMLNRSRINLDYFNLKANLKLKDATTLDKKIKYIVTDPPYGKNTKSQNLEELYEKFISTLNNILGKRCILIHSDKIDVKSMVNKTKLKIVKEFSVRMHKSMTRKILVIEI